MEKQTLSSTVKQCQIFKIAMKDSFLYLYKPNPGYEEKRLTSSPTHWQRLTVLTAHGSPSHQPAVRSVTHLFIFITIAHLAGVLEQQEHQHRPGWGRRITLKASPDCIKRNRLKKNNNK